MDERNDGDGLSHGVDGADDGAGVEFDGTVFAEGIVAAVSPRSGPFDGCFSGRVRMHLLAS